MVLQGGASAANPPRRYLGCAPATKHAARPGTRRSAFVTAFDVHSIGLNPTPTPVDLDAAWVDHKALDATRFKEPRQPRRIIAESVIIGGAPLTLAQQSRAAVISPPSRTLRAAFGGGQEAILDCVCARWPVKSAVGAEECLRRGRTKELDQALAFRPARVSIPRQSRGL